VGVYSMAHEDVAPLHEKTVTFCLWLMQALHRWRGRMTSPAAFRGASYTVAV
jgi:hypothetical protein